MRDQGEFVPNGEKVYLEDYLRYTTHCLTYTGERGGRAKHLIEHIAHPTD